METRRIALLGAAAVVLLGAASLAFVLWPESSVAPADASPDGPGGAIAAPDGGSGVPVLLPAPPPQEAPPSAPEPLVPAPRIRSRPRAASSVAWEQVPAAAKLSDLGPGLAAPVNAALKAARDEMDSCFEEDTRLLESRPATRYGPDDQPRGPAILVLRLESRAGGLDVVDTEVETLGTSTRELVECARHVLKGWPVAAPAAAAGTRYRLKYLLQ